MNKTENEIMSTWNKDIVTPLVSIRCLSFNHGKYIRNALDGFLMQKTNFPFEIVIHDDASTDETEHIIREYEKKYPNIIFPIYEKENQYSKGNIKVFRQELDAKFRGKYVAWCEGDDYWFDEEKLQRQVDFMENNPEYSFCYHPVNYIKEDGTIVGNDSRFIKDCDVSTEQIVSKGGLFCASCSLLCRTKDFVKWPKFREMSDIGDYPLQIHLSLSGKVRYINRVMGCYRLAIAGSWTVTVNGNKDKLIKHFENEKGWLSELNNYTEGKYKEEIRWHIVDYVFDTLVPAGVYSKRKAWRMWKKLSNGSEKWKLAIRVITHNFRIIIKRYFPWAIQFYKKIRFGV